MSKVHIATEMKIERQFVDETEWHEVSEEETIERLSRMYREPEKVLAEMVANEKARPGSGMVRTPNAFYRVVAGVEIQTKEASLP